MNSTFKNGHLLNSTYFSSTREVGLDTRVTSGSERGKGGVVGRDVVFFEIYMKLKFVNI